MQGGCPGFESQWVHARPIGVYRGPYVGPIGTARSGQQTDAPPRVSEGGKGRTRHRSLGVRDDAVCKRDSGVCWVRIRIQFRTNVATCRLVNGSARMPMKDVPSCEKPGQPARRGRTRDFRMGIPTAIASRNGERRELKHLSTDRKRKQTAMSLVTASEHDTA